MRTLSGPATVAIASGQFAKRAMVEFTASGSKFGFWDDGFDISYGGTTYTALGGAMRISPYVSSTDLTVHAADLVISGLDPTIATQVLAASWHQTPVTIYEAIMAIDTPQILNVDAWFVGTLDQIIRTEQIGGMSTLTAKCEPITREFSRAGARTRSDADHRQIEATDGFFKHAGVVGNTAIPWGVLPEQPAQQRSKLFGIF